MGTPSSASSGRTLEQAAAIALFTVVYLGAAELGHWLSVPTAASSGQFATFWPPSGVYLAVLLRTGTSAWPFLGLCALLADLISDVLLRDKSVPVSLCFWAANTAQAMVGAGLLRRTLTRGRAPAAPFTLDRLVDVLVLGTVTTLISAPLGATLGAATSAVAFGSSFLNAWQVWWIGNVLGVLIIAPLLLAPWRDGPRLDRARIIEAVALLVAVLCAAQVVFGANHPVLSFPTHVFPVLLWAALRFELSGAAVAVAALALVGVRHTVLGEGPLAAQSSPELRVLLTQSFLGSGAISFLVLGALMRDRRRASEELRRLNSDLEQRVHERTAELTRTGEILRESQDLLEVTLEQFRRLAGSAPVGIFRTDRHGGCVYVNARWCLITGLTERESRGGGWLDAVHEDDRERVRAAWQQAGDAGTPFAEELRFRHADGTLTWVLAQAVPEPGLGADPAGFIGTLTDITARKRAEESLAEADQRKDEFLAMLAHELRNPLAPIRNAVGLMRLREVGDPSLARARDLIDRQVSHLVRLVDDLLDVSRITRGKINIQREPTEIGAVVATAIECCQPIIEARRHTLERSMPAGPLWIEGDHTRLAQVLQNLLLNAAKYTDEGGRILLSVYAERDHVVILVADNGPGIPREMLPRIFEVFTQVGRTIDRAQGGLGLGLSLVQRLVAMHGGSVEAHSEGPGRGSEFVVRLPRLLRLVTPVAAPARPHWPSGQPNGQREVPPTAEAPARRRVLVVEDNPDVAESLGQVLEELGHEVQVVGNGVRALELARGFSPEVVLLDIGLPGMDGYEVARRLRAEVFAQRPLLVALTGYGQERDRLAAREAGFDRHMVKPVALQDFERLLGAPADWVSA